ncbi:HalOD1 output domain-containing protein [Natrinema sp. SYSU A 869]|uniref:HalOD1 output domain-containing protein n=1 Tax=Natrinema sp. SYSU A 869 TaxID=2871694 RepID=UPI001CA3E8AC|nr:HalOD1 output domain-containing protein [Natrinema sp. SYSU A 869]
MVEGGGSVGTSSRKAPSQAVIEAVADAEDVPMTAVSPPDYQSLHDVVDPTALDALFADRSNGVNRPGGTVSFSFCGYDVTVDQDGTVMLEDATESAD